ncbi:MAG TPA: helix-turn-helix domain-containing protein [Ktedonobacteraceae bacterium]|nr:helix-turn-helix domain-containing protein [Ktedonobacteraceae bacterium]
MSEDLQAQINELRANVQSLTQGLQELRTNVQSYLRTKSDESSTKQETQPANILEERLAPARVLAKKAREQEVKGLVASSGSYADNDRGYQWGSELTAEELLDQDDEKVARVLTAIGNKQRVALLKAILEQPASAAELVERLGMGTTGQVYHHLKALQAADLVKQEERGQFVFVNHRVPSFLMLLAGVHNVLDTRHSSGNWEELENS